MVWNKCFASFFFTSLILLATSREQVNFFDFYGRKLNTSDVGVSCNSSGNFFLKAEKGYANLLVCYACCVLRILIQQFIFFDFILLSFWLVKNMEQSIVIIHGCSQVS